VELNVERRVEWTIKERFARATRHQDNGVLMTISDLECPICVNNESVE
jgi:hypothetical protein